VGDDGTRGDVDEEAVLDDAGNGFYVGGEG
jgi:hypothetical protein